MNEHTSIDDATERRILEARLDEITSHEARDRRTSYILNGLVAFFVTAFVAALTFNSVAVLRFISSSQHSVDDALTTANSRIEQELGEVDKRVTRALKDTQPDRAGVKPLYTEYHPDTLVFDATITAFDDNSQRYYTVRLRALFYTFIEGPPGRLSGLEGRYSGPILEYVTRTRLGKRNATLYTTLTTGKFDPEAGEYGGNFITEYAPFLSAESITFPVKSCSDGVALISEMASRKDLGKVSIKPVFSRITKVPDFREFAIQVREQLDLSCEELALGAKHDR